MPIKKFFYLFFCVHFYAYSQNIRHLSVEEGLPQSFVSGLAQDKEGFIWVATHNGLARYDGHHFKNFQHHSKNSFSLSTNFISQAYLGHKDIFWLRYDNGSIEGFNMQTQEIQHVVSKDFLDKNRLVISRRGWLVASNNLFWFIGKNGQVNHFDLPVNNKKNKINRYYFKNDTIHSIFEDKNQSIWVLSEQALSKFIAKENRFKQYKLPYKMNFDTKFDFGEEIPVIIERSNGELMWLDRNHLYFFNPLKKTFRKTQLPEVATFNGKFLALAVDGKEYFQINETIYCYSSNLGIEKKIKTHVKNNRDTQAFLIDNSGLIWLAANTDGLYQVDLTSNFEAFIYNTDFAVDLLEKEFKISFFDFFNLSETQSGHLPPAYNLRSFNDKQNQKIWIALNRTVCYFDYNSQQLKKIPLLPNNGSNNFIPIKGIALLKNGNPIVIDHKNDIYSYDLQTSSWHTEFTEKQVKQALGHTINPTGLLVDTNKVWITSEYTGLICIEMDKSKIYKINVSSNELNGAENKIYGIVPDLVKDNIFWLASAQGLVYFNKNTLKSALIPITRELQDSIIYSIFMDNSGYLWLGTNKGLCRFDTVSYLNRTFTKQHGLPCLEFNRFHQLILPSGKVAFGGLESGVLFEPQAIREDTYNPNIAITGLKINNIPYKNKKIANTNLLDTIKLPYNQNSLTIEYAALQFAQPEDILYRYRLKGYDTDWILSDNKREAIYTKVPSGSYRFEVNATNTSGVWSSINKVLVINITPPWWKTFWALSLYLLVIILLLILFINYRINEGIMKNEIVLKEKETQQLKELDEMKNRFFSNISHELRTPITLIMGPTEQLSKVKEEKEQKHLLSIIEKNANSLLNLTNQLLDIAKLEAGALKPYMVWEDIIALLKQLIAVFNLEAQSKKCEIIFEGPTVATYYYAPDLMERIMYNLLSNAIKFSNKGGKITISLKELSNGIIIEVKDNGRGIASNELPNIFNRFYHLDANRKEVGNGIGLSLVKEIITLLNGTIKVVSSIEEHDHGTTFIIFLPFEKATHETILEVSNNEEEEFNAVNKVSSKPVILLVEDNKELADFITSSLIPYYTVFCAEDGQKGIDLALEILPDLIISDVLMKRKSGFELCKYLKTDINTNHISIILLTAKFDMESKLEGLSYGADDYISKPFNITELLLRIENRLEQQKKQRNFLYRNLKLLPSETENDLKPSENDFLVQIYGIIDSRLEDENFNVEELATALNMSRTSLHRKIKVLTNLSSGEIIKLYRLKRAVSFLSQKFTISEVAYKTGFGSPSYFTKCFKEVYDCTPTDYIQKKDSPKFL